MGGIITPPSAVTRFFESTEQNIVVNTLLTIPHGFGVIPRDVKIILRCKTAEFSYVVDNELDVSNYIYTQAAGGSYNFSKVVDATNIVIGIGAAVLIPTKTAAFTASTLTPASWKLLARAWW